jgi:hypothetical protein
MKGNVRNIVIYKNVMVTVAEGDNLVRVWSSEDGTLLAVLKVRVLEKNGVLLLLTRKRVTRTLLMQLLFLVLV